MNQKERELIAKEVNSLGENEVFIFKEEDIDFKILILDRGESLFYSEDGKSLILDDFSARGAKLSLKKVNKWVTGESIENKEILIESIKKIYKKAYKDDLEIV
jgi:hypothetical protein